MSHCAWNTAWLTGKAFQDPKVLPMSCGWMFGNIKRLNNAFFFFWHLGFRLSGLTYLYAHSFAVAGQLVRDSAHTYLTFCYIYIQGC